MTSQSGLKTVCWMLYAGLALVPASAGTDIDFGATMSMGDKTNVFVAISGRYFDTDRTVVERWRAPFGHPDDLAVGLFVSRHSGRSLDTIHEMRRSGLSWWDISLRLGISVDAWFVEARHDPGPPYGKAYGYWRKHRADRAARIVLSDDDVRNLVAARLVCDYYGLSIEAAMELRSSGRALDEILLTEYEKRHGHSNVAHDPDRGRPKGQDKAARGGPKHK